MVSANSISPFYSDGILEVSIEYSPGLGKATTASSSKQLPFSIEWLATEEAERRRRDQPEFIFDAETMEAELSLTLNDRNSIFISAKGSLVKVTFGLPDVTNG
ncbi:hypothetical protein PG987_004791 [Apiospora arundinis]